jgi:UDP-glucose 4-epimerase
MLAHAHLNPAKPSRVVILGANGFLARNIGQILEKRQINCRRVGSGEVDLIEPSATEKLSEIFLPDDALVMTAALTPDKGRDVATLMKNLRMAENLSTALARKQCAHLVYISSDAVYDARSPLINEDSSCEPGDLYSAMHIVREKILAQACQGAKIPFATLRPAAVYGAGDTHNSYGPNRFVRTALKEGKITLFGEGEEQRDHVFIDDLTEIVKLCLVHRSTGILNVVSGRSVSFKSVARCICSVTGRDILLEGLPRSSPVTHRHFDITGLLKSFPSWQSTPLEIGIRRMLDGYAVLHERH